MNLRRFGAKVVFFSDTSGGTGRRLRRLARQSPRRLIDDARRKWRRRLHPHRPAPFPQAIHIEVTNACNLRCVMCPRGIMERPVGMMDRALFERIVAQLARQRRDIESVALMGLGEPFLHRRLLEFAALAKSAGLSRLYTSTNATLLTPQVMDALFDADVFDQLILSLDGGKEIYEKLRPGVPYQIVADNVRNLLAAKRRRRARRPEIELQILLMEETEHEVETYCETWAPLLADGDRILIKEGDTFGGQVRDRRPDAQRRREPAVRFACRQLWKDLSIAWDGLVTVCCKDVLYKLAVGNARETELIDLWNSPRWNGIRRLHLEGKWDRLVPCDTCREWWI